VRLDAVGRLRRRRDWLSVAQIGIALAAVALGGGVATTSLALFAVLTGWALWRPLPTEPSRTSTRWWTLGVAAALVGTLARATFGAELLDAGVDFLLLLAVQRFFNRQRAREHLQLLLLGSLLMVVAGVVNTDLAYPPLLVAYLFVASWTLLVNQLLADGERLGPTVMLDVGREGMRRQGALVRAAAGVTLLAVAGAAVVFLFFPRWGVGAFLRGSMGNDRSSGFSDEVQLGDFGRIKSDATVVMRLVVHGRPADDPRPTWHLRGSSFDRYARGRWLHSRDGEASPLRPVWSWSALTEDGTALVQRSAAAGRGQLLHARPIPGVPGSDAVLHATVTLEDLGADVLFVASEPLAVKLRPRGPIERRARVLGGRNREFRVSKPPGPIQYEFLARQHAPDRAALAAIGDPAVSVQRAAFATPAEGLWPRVPELAQQLTEGATTRLQKVEAIMAHLSTFAYTLDLSGVVADDSVDPIETFLFDVRAGHCEYFATALALLLREVGVPTRIVNGYYGAHYNDVGEFYAVRQADAHSWVEVDFGPLGWVTFDPTPPSGRTAGDDASWWPAGAQFLDAARNAYLQWVIDYDFGKQLELLEGLGVRRGRHVTRLNTPAIGLTIGVLCLVGIGLWAWRRRRAHADSLATRRLRRLLRTLARRGHVPTAAESIPAFARRLQREAVTGADALAIFAAAYERHRFGRDPADPAQLRECENVARRAMRPR
jgi:transglutaminase-like putative cysteine protease